MGFSTFGLLIAFLEATFFLNHQMEVRLTAPAKPKTSVQSIDQLPLPGDAIIVITDDLKKGIDRARPTGVLLPPEKFKDMEDELARLRQEVELLKQQPLAGRAESLIDTCILRGQVVGDVLHLQVELRFKTSEANALVPIGLKGVKLMNASLDGESPVWGPDQDGYTVRVKEPKVHQLALDMRLRVTRAEGDRSTYVSLPRSAITRLEGLTIPARVENVLVNKMSGIVLVEHADSEKSVLRAEALGVLDHLELSWRVRSVTAALAEAKVDVVGQLQVFIDENAVETEARVNLETRSGSVSQLRFRLPDPRRYRITPLEIEEEPRTTGSSNTPDNARYRSHIDAQTNLWTLRFDPPLTAIDKSVAVRVRYRQTNLFASDPPPISLGVMELLDLSSSSQRGTITIWQAPGLRVEIQPGTASALENVEVVTQRREDREFAGAFRYSQQPLHLSVQVMPLQPVTEVSSRHVVEANQRNLILVSELSLDVSRAGIREMELDWPAEATLERVAGPSVLSAWQLDKATSKVHLTMRPQKIPWKGTIELHAILPTDSPKAMLALPVARHVYRERSGDRSVPIVHRTGECEIRTPEDLDVYLLPETTGLLAEMDHGMDLRPLRGKTRFRLRSHAPNDWENHAWKIVLRREPRRLEVESVLHVYLTSNELRIEQTFRYDFSAWAPSQVILNVSTEMNGIPAIRWRRNAEGVVEHVNVAPHDGKQSQEKIVPVPVGWAGPCELVLEYSGDRLLGKATSEPLVHVPQARPMFADVRRTRARVWTSSQLKVDLKENSGWETVAPTHSVKGEIGPQIELAYAQGESDLGFYVLPNQDVGQSEILVDEVVIETTGLPDGKWSYRVRYWLSRIQADNLQLLLPGNGRTVFLEKVVWNQQELARDRFQWVEADPGEKRVLLRVPVEPRQLARPAILDVRFQMIRDAEAPFLNARSFPVPELLGRTMIGQTRWKLELPPGRFPITNGGHYRLEQPWLWRGAILAPQPVFPDDRENADVFTEGGPTSRKVKGRGFVFSRLGSLRPLRVVDAPESLWLLVCSFLVLIPGMILYHFPPRRRAAWVFAGICVVAVIGIAAPDWLIAFIFGIQPGVVVLVGLWFLAWIRHRRWRKVTGVMPGFSRLRDEPSVRPIRPSSSVVRPKREPSTVDVPQARLSVSEVDSLEPDSQGRSADA